MNKTTIDIATLIIALGLAAAMWLAIQANDAYSVVTYGIGLLICLAVYQIVHRNDRSMRRQDG